MLLRIFLYLHAFLLGLVCLTYSSNSNYAFIYTYISLWHWTLEYIYIYIVYIRKLFIKLLIISFSIRICCCLKSHIRNISSWRSLKFQRTSTVEGHWNFSELLQWEVTEISANFYSGRSLNIQRTSTVEGHWNFSELRRLLLKHLLFLWSNQHIKEIC